MSVTYISTELRRLVEARGEGLCEYCLIAADDTFYGCEIDHIISEKHGGPTQADSRRGDFPRSSHPGRFHRLRPR